MTLLVACSGTESTPRTIQLSTNLENCRNVEGICLETFPPQCFDYCADEPPGIPPDECVPPPQIGAPDGVVSQDGIPPDTIRCGGEICVIAPVEANATGEPGGIDGDVLRRPDAPPTVVILCPPAGDGCVVSSDPGTNREIIECDGRPDNGTPDGDGTPGGRGDGTDPVPDTRPCAWDDCPAPAPGAPNYLCRDGITIGGPACVRDTAERNSPLPNGCVWTLVECDPAN